MERFRGCRDETPREIGYSEAGRGGPHRPHPAKWHSYPVPTSMKPIPTFAFWLSAFRSSC
jgi:hypothetical protein